MPTPTSIPASASARTARRRLAGGAVPGSVVRQTRSSRVGRETYTLTCTSAAAAREHVEVSDDERAAGDDRERRPRRGELDDARAREPEPSFGRLVRIRRGAERDLLVLPRASGQLAPEHLGDVRLDADRAPVAIVGRTVGALLEVPDVTERAAVRAAHVRIERPAERHAANLCERRLARLDPVLDAHERG